jgi:hypothetical protein
MPQYGAEEEKGAIIATIGRDKFDVPLNWMRVNFTYDAPIDSGTCIAAKIFHSAVSCQGDTIRSLDSPSQIQFTDAGLSRFFSVRKPVFVDRLVKRCSYDTVRRDFRGKTIHFQDMSTVYLIMLPDNSREESIDELKQIPGVTRVYRYEHGDLVPLQE